MNNRATRLIFWTTLILLSCKGTSEKDLVQYREGRQLLNLNGVTREGGKLDEFKVERISPDTVSVGEEFLAKIFLTDEKIDLVAAYCDCKTVENQTVDTVVNTTNNLKRLDGCQNGLIVENDTILIAFRGGLMGNKTFEEITILTRDED